MRVSFLHLWAGDISIQSAGLPEVHFHLFATLPFSEIAWTCSRAYWTKTVVWAQASYNPQTFPQGASSIGGLTGVGRMVGTAWLVSHWGLGSATTLELYHLVSARVSNSSSPRSSTLQVQVGWNQPSPLQEQTQQSRVTETVKDWSKESPVLVGANLRCRREASTLPLPFFTVAAIWILDRSLWGRRALKVPGLSSTPHLHNFYLVKRKGESLGPN